MNLRQRLQEAHSKEAAYLMSKKRNEKELERLRKESEAAELAYQEYKRVN